MHLAIRSAFSFVFDPSGLLPSLVLKIKVGYIYIYVYIADQMY